MVYEKMAEWKGHRLPDLLAAHRILMTGLVDINVSARTVERYLKTLQQKGR